MASRRHGVPCRWSLRLQRRYGYNGALVGLALATFLAPGPLLWAFVVLAAVVSVDALLGTANAIKPLGVSALTFPFVLTKATPWQRYSYLPGLQ
jgi:urea transporter